MTSTAPRRRAASVLTAALVTIACLVASATAMADGSADQAKNRRDAPTTRTKAKANTTKKTTASTTTPASTTAPAAGKPPVGADKAKDRRDKPKPNAKPGTGDTTVQYPSDGGGGFTSSVAGKVIKALFGGIQAKLSTEIVKYLAYSPKYTGGDMVKLRMLVQGLAFGLLGIVMTMTVARYYLAGLTFSGNGGMEAFDGLVRVTWAALMILAWPWVFDNAVNLSNLATQTLINSPILARNLSGAYASQLLMTGGIPGIGMLLGSLSQMIMLVMYLSLLIMKIIIISTNAFLFAAMPLAIVLSPIPELAWLARTAMRSVVATWVIPIIWAILFITAAIIQNVVFAHGGGPVDDPGFVPHMVQPLVGLGTLMAAMTVPKRLMQTAMHDSGVGSRGSMGQFISFAASQMATGFLRSQVPQGMGGTKQPDRWLTYTKDAATGRASMQEHGKIAEGSKLESDLKKTMGEQAHADAKGHNAKFDERRDDRTQRQQDRGQRLQDRDEARNRQQRIDQQRAGDRAAQQQRQGQQDQRQAMQDQQRVADRAARQQREAQQDAARTQTQQDRQAEQAMRYTPPARDDGRQFINNKNRVSAEREYAQWRADQGVPTDAINDAFATLPHGHLDSWHAIDGDRGAVTQWRDSQLEAAAQNRVDPAVRDAHRTLAAGATQWLNENPSSPPSNGGTP